MIQFTAKDKDSVTKGKGQFHQLRGRHCGSRCKRFLEGIMDVKNIRIDSEIFKNSEGRDVRVSTIEIVLGKKE